MDRPPICLAKTVGRADRWPIPPSLESDRIVLEQPKRVLDPAEIAVQLAERSGDPHLVNQSLGVLVHSHLAVEQRAEACGVLEDYRHAALGCCPSCQADWWRRCGDYLVEMRDGAGAHQALNRCLRATEGVDAAGRVDFVHGISHHHMGHRDAALEAELRVLENLSLSSPRGYFLDALAIVAIFLKSATPEHDRHVLHCLGQFRKRIRPCVTGPSSVFVYGHGRACGLPLVDCGAGAGDRPGAPQSSQGLHPGVAWVIVAPGCVVRFFRDTLHE